MSKEDKNKKQNAALKLARERQPTGKLLADVLKKSKADVEKYGKYLQRGMKEMKKVDKTVRGPH